MLGDLGNEFSSFPDSAEDKSLSELGAVVPIGTSGVLGKQSSSLVAKMISTKMPAGFSMMAVREYLQSRWGLGPGRQAGVLLIAITYQPASRLTDVDAARGFFDSIVNKYAALEGITLSTTSAEQAGVAPAAVAVDAATLNALQKDQTEYLTKQLRALAKFLHIDLADHSSDPVAGDTEHGIDLMHGEHGEVYQTGIVPVFTANKARQYRSWWAWAKQDTVEFLENLRSDSLTDRMVLDRIGVISNRSCVDVLNLIEHYIATNPEHAAVRTLYEECQRKLQHDPIFSYNVDSARPMTVIEANGAIKYSEETREGSYVDHIQKTKQEFPLIHLKSQAHGSWSYDALNTEALLADMRSVTNGGISFVGKTALVTGAGTGSIGEEVVKGLLRGGAKVIVTTSRPPAMVASHFQSLYSQYGAKGSALTVLQFNQASVQDCEAVIKHIYDGNDDLDYLIPFAAIPEAGRELDGIDDKSELAHRMMLINTLRLFGFIKTQKESRGFTTRPTQVILPLSPNHGTFGGDGLYSESKLGLETVFNRWSSESWGGYLTICGAVIGWTRGTGLMNANNVVAQAVESHKVMTFSTCEMAFNILGLMAPAVNLLCQDAPVYADLSGGLQSIPDLKVLISEARSKIMETSEIRKALTLENQLADKLVLAHRTERQWNYRPRSNLRFDFPTIPAHKQVSNLRGMVDLSRVVVVVGYSELGPWGNARTRWEMEAFGEFSREGYVEMAWIMGLIKHFTGQLPGTGTQYTGWVDKKTGEPVDDAVIGQKYKSHILEHSGIRIIEPDLFKGYDPSRKETLQEIAIEEDLEPFEASKATAEAFVLRHGDKAKITPTGSNEYRVSLKKGATLLIPKAVSFDRMVAGQIPTGWDPKNYGIADDIVSSVDPITLYSLVAAAEALLSAGITDPFEIYQHLHLSELGICIGSGAGGIQSTRGMYRERWMDAPVQKNVLQETFVNTPAAWVNMLLFGSAGPIKSPVGACATAIEALDIGCSDIITGKAKMCLIGGTDDFNEENSQEFANMQATTSSSDEMLKGRAPGEMSRPTTTSRAGFMESHGSGVQLISSAEVALQMGLPIYGIIASTAVASDKIGRSVPAPGQGVLVNAREAASKYQSPLLDITYRREQLEAAQRAVSRRRDAQLRMVHQPQLYGLSNAQTARSRDWQINTIEQAANRSLRDVKYLFGNRFADQDPTIAPIRAALAVWDLTIDDIDFASLHGTSTSANDKNESDVLNKQMKHLGRSRGNPLIGIAQKSLTGHSKGAAGAYMLNGALQALQTGLVPANRNADDIDEKLRKDDFMLFPNKTLKKAGLKAFSLTSFGFGQKGTQVIGVHPRYIFDTIERETHDQYREKNTARQKKTYTHYNKALMTNTVFQAKNHSPYAEQDESAIYLDPLARASRDKDFDFRFVPKVETTVRSSPPPVSTSVATTSAATSGVSTSIDQTPLTSPPSSPPRSLSPVHMLGQTIESHQAAKVSSIFKSLTAAHNTKNSNTTVGVDVEEISCIPTTNTIFLERNFTSTEIAYAKAQPSPEASLAGRWCAKEAVFKSLGVKSRGAGAPMREIEIGNVGETGRPVVKVCMICHSCLRKRLFNMGIG